MRNEGAGTVKKSNEGFTAPQGLREGSLLSFVRSYQLGGGEALSAFTLPDSFKIHAGRHRHLGRGISKRLPGGIGQSLAVDTCRSLSTGAEHRSGHARYGANRMLHGEVVSRFACAPKYCRRACMWVPVVREDTCAHSPNREHVMRRSKSVPNEAKQAANSPCVGRPSDPLSKHPAVSAEEVRASRQAWRYSFVRELPDVTRAGVGKVQAWSMTRPRGGVR